MQAMRWTTEFHSGGIVSVSIAPIIWGNFPSGGHVMLTPFQGLGSLSATKYPCLFVTQNTIVELMIKTLVIYVLCKYLWMHVCMYCTYTTAPSPMPLSRPQTHPHPYKSWMVMIDRKYRVGNPEEPMKTARANQRTVSAQDSR